MRFHRYGGTAPRPDQALRSAESNGDRHASHPNPRQTTRRAVDGTDRASAWPCTTLNEGSAASLGMRASPRRLRRATGSRAGRFQPDWTSRVGRRDAERKRRVWRPPPCRTRTREREARNLPPAVPCTPLRSRRSPDVRPKCSRTGSHRRAPGAGGRPRQAGRPTPLRTATAGELEYMREVFVVAPLDEISGGGRGGFARVGRMEDTERNHSRTGATDATRCGPNSWAFRLACSVETAGPRPRHGMTGVDGCPPTIPQRFTLARRRIA